MFCKPPVVAILTVMLSLSGFANAQDSGPYKVLKIELIGGDGGFDYVTADPDGRNLYVARSGPAGHIGVYQPRYAGPGGRYPRRKRARRSGRYRDGPRIRYFQASDHVRCQDLCDSEEDRCAG